MATTKTKTKTKIKDFLNVLSKGAINLYQLDQTDQFVLVLTLGEGIIIPLVKDESGAIAYIDEKYSIVEFKKIEQIVNEIFEKAIYKEMYTYSAVRANAPEHSKVVTSYIKVFGSKKAKNADKILADAGYDISGLDMTLKTIGKPRDYSESLKEEKAQILFNETLKNIETVDAKFEDLPLALQQETKVIMAGKPNCILLKGPTGTGKSFACHIMAAHCGAPLVSIQMQGGSTPEDLMGEVVPNTDPNIDSKYVFKIGPALEAWSKGYWFVVDEANNGPIGTMAALNQFTDFRTYIEYRGQIYYRHPNFVCIMTMNPGYAGTLILNMALKNRFSMVDVPALSQEIYTSRLMDYSRMNGHALSTQFFHKLYNFSNWIEKEGNSAKWHESLAFSLRNGQRLIDRILLAPNSFDEFTTAIETQYLNFLSVDNDNSEKLAAFKKSDEVVSQIKALYELYDFSEIRMVDCDLGLDDIFEEVENIDEKDDENLTTKVDDIFNGAKTKEDK